ncbi:MAG TPA: hypothetical protein VK563_06640 [Puia sp.]|nr:hypothetical protein [Puia sp.]
MLQEFRYNDVRKMMEELKDTYSLFMRYIQPVLFQNSTGLLRRNAGSRILTEQRICILNK